MLDINFIKKNIETIRAVCKNKKINPNVVDEFLAADKKRREVLVVLEGLLANKNKANRRIAAAKNQEEKIHVIAEMKENSTKVDKLKVDLRSVEEDFLNKLYQIPNAYFGDVPVGKDASENKVLRQWGAPTKFDFKPKDHLELGETLGIIDTKKAAKITGARFNYLLGAAARLEFAIIQYVMETLASPKIIKKIANRFQKDCSTKTFIPVVPPVMIRPEIFKKMARLSEADKEERYYFPKDDLYLIGSAEHTLGPLHMNEILNEADLPIRYLGFSTSFRREAGSYGKDLRGILRMHQFDKLEMESFTTAENSLMEQNFIIAVQEYLVQSLKIPYQIVILCTGDMGAPDARQIDLECWMPGQRKYRETHTSDLMTDYQARRLNIKVRRKGGKTEFVHMNDATTFAIGRILIAIFENYQQKDGSIKIPKVLQRHCGFKKIVK